MDELTVRQAEVLGMILDFISRNGFPPSYREIAAHFGFGLNAASCHVLALERKGRIVRGGAPRSIRLPEPGS